MTPLTDIDDANRLIDYLINFENVMHSIAADLVDASPETLDTRMPGILQQIVDFERASGGYLLVVDTEAEHIQRTYQWTQAASANAESIQYAHFAWLMPELQGEQPVIVAGGDVPADTRSVLQLEAEQTLIVVLSAAQDNAACLIALTCQEYEAREHDGKLAGRAAGLIASTLERLEKRRAVEDALKNREYLLRTLIDNLPALIYVKDTDSRFLLGNRAILRQMNLESEKDLLGKSDADFHAPDMAAQYREAEAALMQSGTPLLNHEEPGVSHDTGEQHWYSSNKMPLRDSDGSVIGLMGINHNITERKRSEAKIASQERLLRMVVNNLPDIIYMKDLSSRFVMVNAALLKQMGVASEDEILGKTDADFHPGEMAAQYLADEKHILVTGEGRHNYEELAFNRTLNTMRWLSSSKLPLRDGEGNIVGLIGINSDITEQKQITEELEKQVNQRTEELLKTHNQLKLELAERQQREAENDRLQEEVIEAQKQAILELSTPVIPIIEQVLVMPLVGSIDTARATNITRTLLTSITQHRAKVVILDITGVNIVDSGVAGHLNRTMQAARLKGVRTIISGISDAVAETIVDLGIDWSTVDTMRDLQSGLYRAFSYLGYNVNRLS